MHKLVETVKAVNILIDPPFFFDPLFKHSLDNAFSVCPSLSMLARSVKVHKFQKHFVTLMQTYSLLF